MRVEKRSYNQVNAAKKGAAVDLRRQNEPILLKRGAS